ncbi:MAG: carbamoyltransferase HypF [Acidobacteriota bacterium]
MTEKAARLHCLVRGAVQGVGFRPFVYRLAQRLQLTGYVLNSGHGVVVEVEGPEEALAAFRHALVAEAPPQARIISLECRFLDPCGYSSFAIRPSLPGEKKTLILPDLATCPDCLRELFDPTDRRYRYPFINCTHCGPRYSIILRLPYDRPNTTMAKFSMCPACSAEYEDPLNRRFHAQPNACPDCGPQLTYLDRRGRPLARRDEALRAAAEAIRSGAVVALKGIGGFQLLVRAADAGAVQRLRQRKRREEKPFALMAPHLAAVEEICRVSPQERDLLQAPESPIVLLRRRTDVPETRIAPAVAPGNPYLGVMLPYSPLHHLLMAELEEPIVATSGNVSDEPICIDNEEALVRLAGIADFFLVHDRPIARHVDDSVACVRLGRELILRRARGYAPLPVPAGAGGPAVLAVGPHLKNTVALGLGDQVFVSQHIGDLDTPASRRAHRSVIDDLLRLYETVPGEIACDLHPDYASTLEAERRTADPRRVQHHLAHVLACLVENAVTPPVVGVAWDGTGYGTDGAVWGGEFLRVERTGWRRAAHLRPFPLLGGEQAVREPRRAALALVAAARGTCPSEAAAYVPGHGFAPHELSLLDSAWERRLNSPLTSSVGRIFDAVAAILGLCRFNRFEGQAAMAVEFASAPFDTINEAYSWRLEPAMGSEGETTWILDWEPFVEELLADRSRLGPAECVAKFHRSLVEAMVAVASQLGEEKILLTGGCFQNRLLLEHGARRLREAGFRVYTHQRIPPNDGGVAVGQVVAVRLGLDTRKQT